MSVFLESWDPAVQTAQQVLATTMFVADEAIRSLFPNCADIVSIIDCKSFSFAHLRQINFNIMVQTIELCFVRKFGI